MFNIKELLTGLNEGQANAVQHITGPALVTATAGARQNKSSSNTCSIYDYEWGRSI